MLGHWIMRKSQISLKYNEWKELKCLLRLRLCCFISYHKLRNSILSTMIKHYGSLNVFLVTWFLLWSPIFLFNFIFVHMYIRCEDWNHFLQTICILWYLSRNWYPEGLWKRIVSFCTDSGGRAPARIQKWKREQCFIKAQTK